MERAIKKEVVLFFLSITSLEKPFPSPCGSFKNYEPLGYFKWALCYVINTQTGDGNCSL